MVGRKKEFAAVLFVDAPEVFLLGPVINRLQPKRGIFDFLAERADKV
jgi:hypothetical protein